MKKTLTAMNRKLNPFARFARAKTGATGGEYAVIIGIIAIVTAVSIGVYGQQVKRIFTGAEGQIGDAQNGVPTPPPAETGKPTIALTSSGSTAHYGGALTFSWNSTDATSVASQYTFKTGICSRRNTNGNGPFDLSWTGTSGSQQMAWAADLAGCSVQVSMTATNAKGKSTSTAGGSFAVLDNTPNLLTFDQMTGQEPNASVISNPQTIGGVDVPVDVHATGGQFRLGTDWVTDGSASNGDSVELKMITSPAFDTTKSMSLTAGTANTDWSVRTRTADNTPDPISFQALTDMDPGLPFSSTAAIAVGFDGPLDFTVTGGYASIDNGPAVTSGKISENQSIVLTTTSSTTYDAQVPVTITVGSLQTTWNVTTRSKQTVPTLNGSLEDVTGVDPGQSVTSNSVTATNFDDQLSASFANGEISVNNGAWTSGSVSIKANDSVRVRRNASVDFDTSASSTLTIGSKSLGWKITTRSRINAPALSGDFGTVTGAEPASTHASNESGNYPTVTGFEGSATIATDSGAMISTDQGATWNSSVTVSSGASLTVQAQASSSYAAQKTVNVTANGNQIGSFSITTRAKRTAAVLDHQFQDLSNQDPAKSVTSENATVSGFDGTLTAAVDGGEISTDNGGTWGSSADVQTSATIKLRATTSSSFSTDTTANLTVGSTDLASWKLSTRAIDQLPQAVSFAPVTGAEPGNVYTTAENVVLSAFDGPIEISVTNGQISTDNGATFTSSASVNAGDSIKVRVTAPAYGQTLTGDLTSPGGSFGTWTVTSRAIVLNPSLVSNFTDATGANPSAPTTSNIVQVQGFDGSLTASASNGALVSVNGGAFTASAPITSGQTIALQVAASSSFSTKVSPTLSIGATTVGTWNVTTRAIDQLPDTVTFPAKTGTEPGTSYQTSGIALVHFDGPLAITSTDGDMSKDNGGTWSTSLNVAPGDSLMLRAVAPVFGQTLTVHVSSTAGEFASWDVISRAIVLNPSLVSSFTDATGANPSATTTSNAPAVQGFDGSLTASASNGALVSVNGGAFTASASITSGQTIALQIASSSSFSTKVSPVLTIGGTTVGTWNVTTRAIDQLPDNVSFTATTAAEPGTTYSPAESPTLANFDGPLTITATNGKISTDNGVTWNSTASVTPGTAIKIQAVAPTYSQTTTVTLSAAGGNFGTWTVTSRAIVLNPSLVSNFTDVTGANTSTTTTSNAVQVTGFDGSLTASASNGALISVGGSGYVASASITSGQTIALQIASSSSFSTKVSPVLTIGGTTVGTWNVTTRAINTTPTVVGSFAPITNANPTTSYQTSGSVQLTNFDGPLTATVSSGFLSKDAGTTWLTSVSVNPNDQVMLKATSGSDFTNPTSTISLKTNGQNTASWAITLRTIDKDPDAVTFTALTGQDPSAAISSNIVSLLNFDGPQPISITSSGSLSANGSEQYTVDGGATWNDIAASVNVSSGAQLGFRGYASDNYLANVTLTANVNGKAIGAWSVTSRDIDDMPDNVTFTPVTGASAFAIYYSNAVTMANFEETPLPITAVNGLVAIVPSGASIDSNLDWESSVSVNPGDQIALQATAGDFNTTTSVLIQNPDGTSFGTYGVTTGALNETPTLGSFGANGVAAAGVLVGSPSIPAITNFDGALSYTVTNGYAAINGATDYVASGLVTAGDTIQLFGVPNTWDASGNPTTKTVTITFTGPKTGKTTAFTWAVQTAAKDNAPDDVFTFTTVSPADPLSYNYAGPFYLDNFDAPISITTSGVDFSLNGGSYVTSATGVKPGDNVTFRGTVAGYGTANNKTATINIGSLAQKTWTFTARAAATGVIDPVNFDTVYNQAPSTLTQSNQVQMSGFTGTRYVRCTTTVGCYINGSSTRTTVTTAVSLGDTVALGVTSAALDTTTGNAKALTSPIVFATAATGGTAVTYNWIIQTRPANQTPGALTFPDNLGNAVSTVVSAYATYTASPAMTNTEMGVLVSVTPNDGNIKACVGNVNPTCTSVVNNTIRVPVGSKINFSTKTPTAWNASTQYSIKIGQSFYTWNVGTRVQDLDPTPFTFTDVPSTPTTAQISTGYYGQATAFAVTGFDGTIPLKAEIIQGSPTAPQVYTNVTGTWKSIPSGGISLNVTAGKLINIYLATKAAYVDTYKIRVTLGSYSTVWTVTTRPYNANGCAAKVLAYGNCSATFSAAADKVNQSLTWSGSSTGSASASTSQCADGGTVAYTYTWTGTGTSQCYDAALKLTGNTCTVKSTASKVTCNTVASH